MRHARQKRGYDEKHQHCRLQDQGRTERLSTPGAVWSLRAGATFDEASGEHSFRTSGPGPSLPCIFHEQSSIPVVPQAGPPFAGVMRSALSLSWTPPYPSKFPNHSGHIGLHP
jgi:hypothetical protein